MTTSDSIKAFQHWVDKYCGNRESRKILMSQELRDPQTADLTANLPKPQGVCFDPEMLALHGIYRDELSIYRARKHWSETLSTAFLLDKERDFEFSTECDYENSRFILRCQFMTACGRYAFWRLTNDQAPEAQYEIETAHIPDALSRHEQFVAAPDLKSMYESPLVTAPGQLADQRTFSSWLQEILARISKSF